MSSKKRRLKYVQNDFNNHSWCFRPYHQKAVGVIVNTSNKIVNFITYSRKYKLFIYESTNQHH